MKVAIVFGTRPEIIKLYPLMKLLPKAITIAVTQHTDLLIQTLSAFEINPTYHLTFQRKTQDLSELSQLIHQALAPVLEKEKPDLVMVVGDTPTTLAVALEAFYQKIKVAHVEAGMRTNDLTNPYPEEGNRRMIAQIASYHFAPSTRAKRALKKENVGGVIKVVGNTGVDTAKEFMSLAPPIPQKMVLVTLHRRESWGKPIKSTMEGIVDFACPFEDWDILFITHPNPLLKNLAKEILGDLNNVYLSAPLGYQEMIRAMELCSFIVTDSAGVQEDAITLNKPVLVAREKTSRMEAVEIGASKIVGTNRERVAQAMIDLARSQRARRAMINKRNPYGDGKAAEKIVKILAC